VSDTTTIEDEADEQFCRDAEAIAFPKIDDRQLAMLEPLGQRRVVRAGEVLFKAGQRDLGLVLILSGELEVVEQRDGTELVLGERGPAQLRRAGRESSRQAMCDRLL
jgi:thioredoxin reductase (NADPH)